MPVMGPKQHVLVIGAGVTGLTTALLLAEADYEVIVIAAHVPGDESIEYTSPWAGAHWRTHSSTAEPILCDWEVQTFNYWVDLMERERRDPSLPKSGLKMEDQYHFWDQDTSEELWWAPYVRDFHQLSLYQDPVETINRTRPANAHRIEWAAACRVPLINVPQYLLYLQDKGRSLGVKVIKARLPTDAGFEKALLVAESTAKANGAKPVDCFLNATGLQAYKLCGDQAMYPVRGQTVLVKGEADKDRARVGVGYTAYCIPRPGSGTTILGGTNEKNNWSEEADPETTMKILEKCSYFVPELLTAPDGGFEVISAQCGLRPARHGGPRVEREVVGGKKVVHAYGHSGGGYQMSIGSARLAVKLVVESIGGNAFNARL